jgi:hypothetical protein
VDGVFRGTGCADAIQVLDRDNSTVSIIGGEFSVKDIDKVIAPLNDDPWNSSGVWTAIISTAARAGSGRSPG